MRTIELTPQAQKILELKEREQIRKCNEQIRKNQTTYDNWESVTDERLLKYTKEEYKEKFIDYWFEQRKYHVYKLNRQIREGFVFE